MWAIRSCSLNTILDLMHKWILLNHFKYRNVFWICVQAVSAFPWSLIPKRSQRTLSDQIKTAPQNPTPMNSVLFSKAACKLLLWHLVWRLVFFLLNDSAFHEKEFFFYFSAQLPPPMENISSFFSTKYTGSFALFSTVASLCCGSIVISFLKERSEA